MSRRGFTLLNSSKRNFGGFTVIELIIVVTIMGILITLGTINFRGTLVYNRDAERKADIETISQYLEIYYSSGTDMYAPTFDYPPTTMALNISNTLTYLRDIDSSILLAPGVTASSSLIAATSATTPLPTIGDNDYVYQPLQTTDSGGTWSLCTDDSQDCRKYNLYYHLEQTTVSLWYRVNINEKSL